MAIFVITTTLNILLFAKISLSSIQTKQGNLNLHVGNTQYFYFYIYIFMVALTAASPTDPLGMCVYSFGGRKSKKRKLYDLV